MNSFSMLILIFMFRSISYGLIDVLTVPWHLEGILKYIEIICIVLFISINLIIVVLNIEIHHWFNIGYIIKHFFFHNSGRVQILCTINIQFENHIATYAKLISSLSFCSILYSLPSWPWQLCRLCRTSAHPEDR